MRRLLVALAIAGCGDDAIHHLPDAPPAPDAVDAAPACPPLAGAGTMHGGSVGGAETWTAAASPHVLPFDMSITAPLTIEACAVVRIGGNRMISVRAGGSITTLGMPGQPVRI